MIFRRTLFLLCIAVIGVSCKKKEGCTDATALNYDASAEKDCCCEYQTTFHLDMHLHPYFGATPLAEGSTFVINGVSTRLDITRFYISNIRLVDASGNETAIAGKYLLVTPEFDDYDIGDVEAQDYTSVKFDIGVDSVTNHEDPAQYQLGDPLGFQTPPMHWGWDIGYIFMRVDGEADTTGDAIPDKSFQMHLGTDDFLSTATVDYAISASAGGGFTIHLNVLWNKLFEGVDMTGNLTTHTTDSVILAEQLVSNIGNMFVKEE